MHHKFVQDALFLVLPLNKLECLQDRIATTQQHEGEAVQVLVQCHPVQYSCEVTQSTWAPIFSVFFVLLPILNACAGG